MPFNLENSQAYDPKRNEEEIDFFNKIGLRLEQEYEGLKIQQDRECFILNFGNKKVFVQKSKFIEMADETRIRIEDHLRKVIEENDLIKKEAAEKHFEQAA